MLQGQCIRPLPGWRQPQTLMNLDMVLQAFLLTITDCIAKLHGECTRLSLCR
jgi:hypothetical protein